MAKTKAKDRIELLDGRIMTLGEALDAKIVQLVLDNYYDPPRYFARQDHGDQAVTWEVGETLYRSRVGLALPWRNK